MPSTQPRPRLHTPRFLKGYEGDFPHHFRKLFITAVLLGSFELKRDPMLPVPSRARRTGLHCALQAVVEQGCFPAWFRQRLFFSQDPIFGPHCEELDSALLRTAIYTGEGEFKHDMFTETSFKLNHNRVDWPAHLKKYGVSQKQATHWGVELLRAWDRVNSAQKTA